MRFVNLFTDSPLALLYTARLVNVSMGLLTAYFVLLLGKKLFSDSRMQWLFCFLVIFLPQSLFLHTYVNPDSMCLLSTALMLYGLVCGYKDGFSVKSCTFLTIGIILCTLSYYNAYGFILGSIVLFTAYFLKKDGEKWRFQGKSFLKKGLSISLIVLLFTSWSFIRNYILYDGDIIGLTTKENFVKSFGIVRETYASRGEPLSAMLFRSLFLPKLAVSFVANYGSSTLYAPIVVYIFYLMLFATGIFSMVFVRPKDHVSSPKERKWLYNLFHAVMVFCIVMPLFLVIRYSYTVDFQAQGRYIMPCIIPFMYYVTRGLEKLTLWRKSSEKGKNVLTTLALTGIVTALLLTVMNALPYYLQVSVL